ncbi:Terminase-like family [Dehalogenimonas alkenigignens]|uniref:Terminase-like family n=1 Tax=Dehalogenimonas alkenigignens TaxID=1217799 RepID=A0A0W0GKS2_9CHLR|nr:hypothetical protein [Dehalogenimonas alkenigignens]KTB49162.1 Terminase-like family [Dehalogenimonas alkenigignens]
MNPVTGLIDDLRPYQLEIGRAVLASVRGGRGLTFTVEIARQGGKNELSACLEARLLNEFVAEPLNIIKCAPTFEPQAMISMRRLRGLLDAMGYAGDYAIESGHIVRLHQARVVFLSAEPSASVVGNTAHLLLEVDEAQDVAIEKFDRDFRPMAAAMNATTVLYGTPWRDTDLLSTVGRRNLELEAADGVKRHFRYDWQAVAEHNPAYRAYVEGERLRLGENHPAFRSQYALLPAAGGGGFFTDEQLIMMLGDHPRQRSPRPGAAYVGGLDFGGEGKSAGDSTVLTIAEVSEASLPLRKRGIEGDLITPPTDGNPVGTARGIRVVQHYAWSGLPFSLLLPKIVDITRGWGLRRLAADATGLGGPLCASLKQSLGHRIVPFVFTQASKSDLGFNLLAAAGTGRLHLYKPDNSPECLVCRTELENAAADYRPNRAVNFYVDPAKGHDDYVMSLALVVEAANRYEPRAAVGIPLK